MSLICFHASHEQFSPSRLLKLAISAQEAGFEAIHSSDHFHPWSKRQGESGFSFAWLGAAMQATSIPFSVVCAPGQRYHPAIVAQAIATLAEMFPSRFDVELGTGEALNESIVAEPWPSKDDRCQRLEESVSVIRRLLNGEEVTHKGMVNVQQARLYTLPTISPLIYGAAISDESCAWVGSWADGLLTTADGVESAAKKIEIFRQNGGYNKPFNIQLCFSYATTMAEAEAGAYDQWRTNLIAPKKLANVSTTEQFDELAETITIEDVTEAVKPITTIADLLQWIAPYRELGASRIILHNIHPNQEHFIAEYGHYHAAYDSTTGLSV